MPRRKPNTPQQNTIPAAPVVPISQMVSQQESEGVPLTEAEKAEMEANPRPATPAPKPQQSAFMQGVLKCHTCGRTGEEDLAECPNLSLPNFTCPEPTAIDPDTDVVLHSAALGIIRTVPVESLVRGHAQRYLAGCHTDNCGYKVLHPKAS